MLLRTKLKKKSYTQNKKLNIAHVSKLKLEMPDLT